MICRLQRHVLWHYKSRNKGYLSTYKLLEISCKGRASVGCNVHRCVSAEGKAHPPQPPAERTPPALPEHRPPVGLSPLAALIPLVEPLKQGAAITQDHRRRREPSSDTPHGQGGSVHGSRLCWIRITVSSTLFTGSMRNI